MDIDINRIKVILVEKKRSNKWLAELIHRDAATVFKWCTNASKPSIESFLKIVRVLDMDVQSLFRPTAQDHNIIYVKIPKDCVII